MLVDYNSVDPRRDYPALCGHQKSGSVICLKVNMVTLGLSLDGSPPPVPLIKPTPLQIHSEGFTMQIVLTPPRLAQIRPEQPTPQQLSQCLLIVQ